ncbi:DUF6338 family protein [Nonomuraea sp. NPDC049480]|uniref:DUF6338 family protein n=1 Tax=Nonomuraea sp. NPDC049480 TaxID=3364353 RepID=UPI0037A27024
MFVVLLLPGFVYILIWERKAPHRRFRETVAVGFGSILAALTVLGLFIVFHVVVPTATPDLDKLNQCETLAAKIVNRPQNPNSRKRWRGLGRGRR